MNKTFVSEDVPAAVGPYSQAVQAGNTLYLSGMLPVNPKTGNIEGTTVAEQTTQIVTNIEAMLKTCGYSVNDVVKTLCFLSDIGDFAEFNKVYGDYFVSKPARSCVAVRDIPKGALVEVEVIAYKD